jgi:two-component system, LuxR family, response regulator FixJ
MALILIVDDDLYVRSSLENLLASAGYESASLASGEEFVSRMSDLYEDCVILDVKMKGMSGLDVQQRLNEHVYRKPIIFLSAHSDTETREKALAAGAFAFLAKPFDEQELLDTIARAISAN